jgi:hypothetical protein
MIIRRPIRPNSATLSSRGKLSSGADAAWDKADKDCGIGIAFIEKGQVTRRGAPTMA